MQIFPFPVFFDFVQNHSFPFFALFRFVSFCTNKGLDSLSRNDCLNFSFVKDKHIIGTKMARYGRKVVIFCELAECTRGLRPHLRP